MKKLIPAFLFFSTISFCIFSFGQSSALEQCGVVNVAMERLACYDAITASIQPEYCSVEEHSWSTECGGNIAPGYCAASENSLLTECGGGGFYQLQQLQQQPYYCSYNLESWRTECGGHGDYQLFLTQQQITIVGF